MLRDAAESVTARLSERAERRATAGSPAATARGLFITLPVMAILFLLLLSSDAFFAGLFTLPTSPGDLPSHVMLFLLGAVGAAILITRGLRAPVESPLLLPLRLRGAEVAMLFGGTTFVYGLFVTVQVVAALAGDAYVQQTSGLTVAEYARSGFFQLLAAAAFTFGVLIAGKRFTGDVSSRAQRVISMLGQATIVLTLVTVGVAIRRLFLYEASFGLTMLRLFTIVFAVWIGVVFLLTSAHLHDRLPVEHLTAILTTAFVALVAMNVANPEAIVAERNIERFAGTGKLDVQYLTSELGPDAVPVLVKNKEALRSACDRSGRPDNQRLHYNHSRIQAFELLDAACEPGWGSGWIFD